MKRLSLVIICFFSISLIAQQTQLKPLVEENTKKVLKLSQHISKAPTDTLYYQDFAGGIPTGWSVINNAGNSNNWIWSNSAPGGQYSSSMTALNSTSATNGFMSLPSDWYNTPALMPTGMDVSIQSGPISIIPTAAVNVVWQQANRYCCSFAMTPFLNGLFLEVSNDGVNWTAFSAVNGRKPNEASPNPEIVSINVSSILSNEDTAYIRFHQVGPSHYYWMLDDVAIVEGVRNEVIIDRFYPLFNSNYASKPIYTQLSPQLINPNITFLSRVKNLSGINLSNVVSSVELLQDINCHGNATNVSIANTEDTIALMSSLNDTLFPVLINPFLINSKGDYHFVNTVRNDSFASPRSRNKVFEFKVSDTVLAKDWSHFDLYASLSSRNSSSSNPYLGSFSTLFNLTDSVEISSISIYSWNDVSLTGLILAPKIWSYNENVSSLDSAILPINNLNGPTLLLDTNHLGRWISLPFNSSNQTLPPGQYLAGIEVVHSALYQTYAIGVDCQISSLYGDNFNFAHLWNHQNNYFWYKSPNQLAIRLNTKGTSNPCAVGVNNQKLQAKVEIYPNPSTGQFALRLQTEKAKQYTLKVRNNLGQIVLEEQVNVNGHFAKAIDLSQNEAGIYFLSLENEFERLVEKVVLQ